MLTRKQRIQHHLDLMAEIVLEELQQRRDGSAMRIDLVENLGLKMSSYPHEAATQAETTWLANILLRRLQDEGRVIYGNNNTNHVVYKVA